MSITFSITGPMATDGGRSATVNPGDPVAFDWGISPETAIPADVGVVRGRLRIDDAIDAAWESEPIDPAMQQAYRFTGPTALYTRGLHAVHLRIAGLRGGRPYVFGVATVLILVNRPALAATAWHWDAPADPSAIAWRQPYQVSGTLTAAVAVTGSVNLTERNVDDHVTTVTPTATLALAAGAATTLPFASETQVWEWIIPAIFVVRPNQYAKTFAYTVIGVVEDPFRNRFTIEEQLLVVVTVPPWKLTAGIAAMNGAGLATTLLLLAVAALNGGVYTIAGAATLAIAAGAAYSAAANAYLLAVDPPAPDPWYRDRVELAATPQHPLLATDKQLAPYARFLELATRMPATGTALSVVEGRILGAAKDGDTTAQAKQQAHAKELHASWEADARDVITAAEAVRDLGALDPVDDTLAKTAVAIRAQGLPPSLRALWVANALPRETLDALEQVLQRSESPPSVTQAIFDWSACLARMPH